MEKRFNTKAAARATTNVYDTHHFFREWRLYRDKSVETLAKEAGLSMSMISQLERGRTSYTEATLIKLAVALQCKAWELLCSAPDNPRPVFEKAVRMIAPRFDFDALGEDGKRRLEDLITANLMAAINGVERLQERDALMAKGWRQR